MKAYVGMLVAALTLLPGCTAIMSGNERLHAMSASEIRSSIIIGKTDKDEIRSLLGGPDEVSFTDSGLLIWRYDFTLMAQKIPFTSAFQGSKKELTILYDKEGRVQEFSYEQAPISRRVSLFYGGYGG